MEKKRSNATLGADTEKALAELLAGGGWFCAIIPRGAGGAQPFDLMAVKGGGFTIGVDAKRSQDGKFRCSRVEANQFTAMDALESVGSMGFFAVFLVKDPETGDLNETSDAHGWRVLRWLDIRPYADGYNRGGKNIDLLSLPCVRPLDDLIFAGSPREVGRGDA